MCWFQREIAAVGGYPISWVPWANREGACMSLLIDDHNPPRNQHHRRCVKKL